MAERLRQREVMELMKLYHLCCKKGLYKEARRVARTAHKLDPDNAAAKAAIHVARALEKQADFTGVEYLNSGKCGPMEGCAKPAEDMIPPVFDPCHDEMMPFSPCESIAPQALEEVAKPEPTPEAPTSDEKSVAIENEVARLYELKNTLYREGKYREAQAVAQKILELHPDITERWPTVFFYSNCQNAYSAGALSPAEVQSYTQVQSAQENEIAKRLEQPISLDFKDAPLSQVIDDLHDMSGLDIVPDRAALEGAGISLESPLTFKLENVSMNSAVTTLLQQLHLAYVVKDGMVVITTAEAARGKLVTATYPIADMEKMQAVARSVAAPLPNNPDPAIHSMEGKDALIQLITHNIAPESWSVMGGVGTIDYWPESGCLVVNQTVDVQEQVADMLTALRGYLSTGQPLTNPCPNPHHSGCTR
jgi:tetratricopeptide (TPR) repeat protein